MGFSTIDLGIIIFYGFIIFGLGIYFSKLKSTQNLKGYFMGDNEMAWYWLGLSNSSGMFDINAISWRLAMLLIYGVQSLWIPWIWPVWNQIFLMIFLSTWLRRSEVMTGAEWMRFRFGDGLGGKLSHGIIVVFALFEVILSIGSFFKGIGGLAAALLPNLNFSFLWGLELSSANTYAIIICLITTIYSIKGGIYSVIATEVLQYFIMIICCLAIFILGYSSVDWASVSTKIPAGWLDFFPKKEIAYEWMFPAEILNKELISNGFQVMAGLLGIMIAKGLLASLAGPVPGFDMQRTLSTKSPKEAAKMSAFTILVLFSPLYMIIGGFAVMALSAFPDLLNSVDRVEEVFFQLIINLPTGLKGLIIAGLLAAFMSTFSAFVNVGPAYFVNDLIKRYIYPEQSSIFYVRFAKRFTWFLVLGGIYIGTQVDSLNSIIIFITSAFYGAYVAPNVLKWVWWKFTGFGYFLGMLFGMISTLFSTDLLAYMANIFPIFKDFLAVQTNYLVSFFIILFFSLMGSIIGTVWGPKDDPVIAQQFYLKTRPWGFWKPIYLNLGIPPNNSFATDMLKCLIGIIWQMSLIAWPIYAIFRNWELSFAFILCFLITSLILYKFWFKKL